MAEVNLIQGLENLKNNVRQLQAQSAISSANERVREIRATTAKEDEQKVMMQQTANDLMGRLAALNTSPQQAALAFQSIVPETEQKKDILQFASDLDLRNTLLGAQAKASVPSKDDRARFVAGYGFAPDKESARAFRKQAGEAKGALMNIDKLAKFGGIDKINPKARAAAQTLATVLQGSLRVPLVGPGNVSDEERKLLNDALANPTDILTIFPGPRLKALKSAIQNKLRANAQVMGFTRSPGDLPGGGAIEQTPAGMNLSRYLEK